MTFCKQKQCKIDSDLKFKRVENNIYELNIATETPIYKL